MSKLLLVVVALALVVAVVGDGSKDGDREGGLRLRKDDKPGKHFSRENKVKARRITFKSGDHSVSIVCNPKDGVKGGSRLEFGFSTIGFPRFRARYFNKTQAVKALSDQPNNDDDHDDGTKTIVEMYKYRIGLQSVVEFTDTNGNGLFDVAERTSIVQRFKFWGVGKDSWTDINKLSSADAAANGYSWTTSLSQSVQTGSLPNGPKTATLKLTLGIADGVVEDLQNNRTLQPNSFKFDIDLDDWTYVGNGTQLAFIFRLEAKNTVSNKPDLDDSNDVSSDAALAVGKGGHFGWVSQVQATATQGAATIPFNLGQGQVWVETDDDKITHAGADEGDNDNDSDEVKQLVAFSIQNNADGTRPTYIHWDPSVAINDDVLDAESGSDSAAVSTTAGAIAVALAAAAALLL